MHCLFGCLGFLAPRITIVVLQLATGYVTRAYDTLLWPVLGFIFLPLTTLAYAWAINSTGSVEGVRLVKEHLPLCKTVLGISNVSFGLPGAGREVVNSVFLYECTRAGLDMAIVNTQKLERYASIPEEERVLAERVLFETSDDVIWIVAGGTYGLGTPEEASEHQQFRREYLGPRGYRR